MGKTNVFWSDENDNYITDDSLVNIQFYVDQYYFFASTPVTLSQLYGIYRYEVKVENDQSYNSLFSADLPPGFSLSVIDGYNAVIEGIFTNIGSFDFVIYAYDGSQTIQQDFTVVVREKYGVEESYEDDFLGKKLNVLFDENEV